MPTAADLAEHEAHRGHPAPLTGRCNVGACRRFPIQGKWQPGGYHDQPYGTVPWSVAEVAYAAYAARYGRGQSIETMAGRGGFGHVNYDPPESGQRADRPRRDPLRCGIDDDGADVGKDRRLVAVRRVAAMRRHEPDRRFCAHDQPSGIYAFFLKVLHQSDQFARAALAAAFRKVELTYRAGKIYPLVETWERQTDNATGLLKGLL